MWQREIRPGWERPGPFSRRFAMPGSLAITNAAPVAGISNTLCSISTDDGEYAVITAASLIGSRVQTHAVDNNEIYEPLAPESILERLRWKLYSDRDTLIAMPDFQRLVSVAEASLYPPILVPPSSTVSLIVESIDPGAGLLLPVGGGRLLALLVGFRENITSGEC